ALGARWLALGWALALLPRRQHPREGYDQRHCRVGNRFLGTQGRFTVWTRRLPVATQRFGPPIERALRRRHGPPQLKEVFAVLGGHMRHRPWVPRRRAWGPGARDEPCAPCQRAQAGTARRAPIEATRATHRACRPGRGPC